MLVLSIAVWASVSIVFFLLPPLLPVIRADLSITNGQAGIALSAFYVAYGVSQYPGGRLSDQWNHSVLIFPAIVLLGVGTFIIGTASSLIAFVVACLVLGVGRGFFSIPTRVMLSELYPSGKGRALGYFNAASDIGGIIAAGVAILVLAWGRWQLPFAVIGFAFLGLSGLFLVWTHEPWSVSRRDLRNADLRIGVTLQRIRSSAELRWLLVGYTSFNFMVNGVLSFLPAFLHEAKGMSPALAGGVYAILFLLGIVVKPLSGDLSDRFPSRTVAAAGLSVSAVALVLLLFADSLPWIILFVVSFTVGYKMQFPIMDAILMDNAPTHAKGGDLGTARAVFHVFGSMGPAFVGQVADRFDFTVAFAVLCLCLLFTVVIFVIRQ